MIRIADLEDYKRIMNFIDLYWKKKHILSMNENFFLYEFANNKKLNFIISENNDKVIDGILGFISYGTWGSTDIFTVMWRVINHNNNNIGYKMYNFLLSNKAINSVSSLGINPSTISYYKFIGLITGNLNHWYRLNKLTKYNLGIIVDSSIPSSKECPSISVKKIYTIEDLSDFFIRDYDVVPLKSKEYFNKRYFKHPIYEYMIFNFHKIDCQGALIVVMRIDVYKTYKALRIIDMVGNFNIFYSLGHWIDCQLAEYECEFVDIYEKGLESNILISCGFRDVEKSGNIIPNYFNPFEQRNITINYATTLEGIILFKGDGDQDRPS